MVSLIVVKSIRNSIRAKIHPVPSPNTFNTKRKSAVKKRCIHGAEYRNVSAKKMATLVIELRFSSNEKNV